MYIEKELSVISCSTLHMYILTLSLAVSVCPPTTTRHYH